MPLRDGPGTRVFEVQTASGETGRIYSHSGLDADGNVTEPLNLEEIQQFEQLVREACAE